MVDFVASFEKKPMFEAEGQKIEMIEIERIVPDQQQVRQYFDDDKLKELADSIREHGIQNPIHVIKISDEKYQILTGERRYRAAKIVNLGVMPCIVHLEEMTETKRKALQLIENLQRQDLGAIETAKGFDALIQGGMGQREIARHLGISEGTVSKGITILKKIPEKWLAEIEKHYKTVSVNELYPVAKEKNANKKAAAYQKLMASAGQKIEIETEEPKKRKEITKSEFTSEQFETAWENLKKAVRRDRGKLAQYITANKIQALLEYLEE